MAAESGGAVKFIAPGPVMRGSVFFLSRVAYASLFS